MFKFNPFSLFVLSFFFTGLSFVLPARAFEEVPLESFSSFTQSTSSSAVSLIFPRNVHHIYNNFQIIQAESEKLIWENGVLKVQSFKEPDAKRLDPWAWRRLLSHDDNRVEVSCPVELRNYSRFYEVWGTYAFPGSNTRSDSVFLGHIQAQKQPTSFADFLDQNRTTLFFSGSEVDGRKQFNQKLKQAVEEKQFWTRVPVRLDTQKDPQKYQLEELLGAGADGYVLRAVPVDPENPPLAIKMFSDNAHFDSVKKLLLENEILGRQLVPQESIAKLLYKESQPLSGMTALVMEYIEGETLSDFLEKKPVLSVEEGHKILQSILAVVSQINLYDLTRDNILIQPDHAVKFIDFAKWEWGSSLKEQKGREKIGTIVKEILDRFPDSSERTVLQETIKKEFPLL